ncbi:MAG: hypothetical protein PSV18_15960 [Methylobacter sp.]|nr:hypothetical protein [Candidatus Methylobacter titanis]
MLLLKHALRNTNKALDRLQQYKIESEVLESKYQHFIGEMIMLRLFSTFEDCVAEIAYKIAVGAAYSNGTQPILNVKANSVGGSRSLFLIYGRPKPIQNLKWTKAKYIRESVQHIMPVNEKFITNAQIHGALIDEMRKVRNVLAHNTSSAKVDFRDVVRQIYGANIKITAGAFLCSTRRSHICNLSRYIASTRIILSDIAKGS